MKKLFLSVLALVLTVSIHAQVKTPAPSPFSKIEQVVGLTDVSVEYSRPNMRGRTIFGGMYTFILSMLAVVHLVSGTILKLQLRRL